MSEELESYSFIVKSGDRSEAIKPVGIDNLLSEAQTSLAELVATFPEEVTIEVHRGSASEEGESLVFETNNIAVLNSWMNDVQNSTQETWNFETSMAKVRSVPEEVERPLPAVLQKLLIQQKAAMELYYARLNRSKIQDPREYLAVLFETDHAFHDFSQDEKAALLALAVDSIANLGFFKQVRTIDAEVSSKILSLGARGDGNPGTTNDDLDSEYRRLDFALARGQLVEWCDLRVREDDAQEWILQNIKGGKLAS